MLRYKNPRKIGATLDSLGNTVTDAYEEVLDRLAKEEICNEVFEFLSWIFHAKECFLMDELREALAVHPEDRQLQREQLYEPVDIIEECKSLLSYDEASGIVKFTHSAVQDFLQSVKKHGLLSEIHLAKTLLTYLSFDVFNTPCSDDVELQKRITGHRLSRYAARWWPEYVRGEGEFNSEIQNLVSQIFVSRKRMKSILQIESNRVGFPSGITLLHLAAFHGLIHFCEMIIDGGSKNQNRSIAVASKSFYRPDFGNVHSRDGYGETPLHVAARKGCGEIVKLLISAQADVNARSRTSMDMTPLHLAVIHGHTGVVETLIKSNADLNSKGRYWETPLLLSALLGRVEMVEMLLEAKADRTATTERGETAIMLALISPNATQVVKSLLKAGADVDARDVGGRTALHYALELYSFSKCKEVLELLLEAGANINIHCSSYGDTPLHTAARIDLQRRQYEINLQKMETVFSSESTNDAYARRYAMRMTPLPKHTEMTGTDELTDIVQLLLDWKADSKAKNYDGDSPLQCAIRLRSLAPAVLLLGDIDCKVDFTMDKLGDQQFLNLITKELMIKE